MVSLIRSTRRVLDVAALLGGLALAVLAHSAQAEPGADGRAGMPAPEFTHRSAEDWLNAPPQSLVALRGKVVLIDFWTFECWNCYRSFPWLNAVHESFAGQPFQVVGVHSPEFARERDRRRVAAKVREFKLEHPVMIDNDYSYWKALDNHYWPAFYLIDKRGRIRYRFAGETHSGDRRALEIERRIHELIAEPS